MQFNLWIAGQMEKAPINNLFTNYLRINSRSHTLRM